MGKHRDKHDTWRLFIVIWHEWGDSGRFVMERRQATLLAPSRKEAARLVRLRNPNQMHHVCVVLAPGE